MGAGKDILCSIVNPDQRYARTRQIAIDQGKPLLAKILREELQRSDPSWGSIVSTCNARSDLLPALQIVVLVDAKLVNRVLGSKESLNKGIEPDGSDAMISMSGHRTLFSADTNSKYWRLIRKGTTAAFQYKNIR